MEDEAVHDDPPLALDAIQGIAIPGFFKPHQALLSLTLPRANRRRSIDALAALLPGGNGPGVAITTGAQALADRERHRQQPAAPCSDVLLALALTPGGIDWLSLDLATTVPSPAFQSGMAGRAGLLGDPAPAGWRADGPRSTTDLLFVLAGDDRGAVAHAVQALVTHLRAAAPLLMADPPQFGNVRSGAARGHEHFGFADGVSQPGIRGKWNGQPITRRTLPASDPEHDLFGQPGQHLVWPGEFVLGYPGASPDPRLPGPVRPVPAWMHDGSFLVYRRLRQHVHRFRQNMATEAARLRSQPGFQNLTADRLAALLVGRWPSGAPVSRMPYHDCPPLGESALMNNDFRFDDDTPPRSFASGALPPQWLGTPPRSAQADPLGLACPVGSHIRKVNLRDQASDVGGASATQSRRILRVGVPYGDDLPEDATEDDGKDRGLLFLSIQASIEDQFEFLQARWINNRVRPRGPGGNDMIVGQNAASPDGQRRCVLFGTDQSQQEVVAKESFVTMTGGGYFFVPSLPTLRALLQGALPPTPLPGDEQ